MNIFKDDRIVLTLDAGGTNFVFSAMQRGAEIVAPITKPSQAHDLDLCLKNILDGFQAIKDQLPAEPVAISFAFPGPADYKNGVIGTLPNLPAFRKAGGVALGPMLEDHFQLPTFIGNDGDLFAYGESIAGILPRINTRLKERGVSKTYSNLLGVTLGTGFGGGMVINNELCQGDNSSGGEIWLTRNFRHPRLIAEEGACIRAVLRSYTEKTGRATTLSPKDIYDIAQGKREGDQAAALYAFDEMAAVIAESLCNAITLIDGIIVIGGGLAGAYPLLGPRIAGYMSGTIEMADGTVLPRLVAKVYDLEDEASCEAFLDYSKNEVIVPFSGRKVQHNLDKRIAIGTSHLGTNTAIALGAYAIALKKLSTNSDENVLLNRFI
jgi:glucokinase